MTKEENEKRLARLKNIVLNMPDKPGSYQFYDDQHTIIYIGKAKRLKARVSSYFHKEVDRYKTKVLVSKIQDISYTVVNSEEDALLLENNLIKKYNPRYNVLLKDGKTYPSICITNEYFPRIFKTRTIEKHTGTFYGPYPQQGRFKPCLEYHLHNCNAPCINKQSYEDYQENMKQAREILKGNNRAVAMHLEKLMLKNAELLKFEAAQDCKEKLMLLQDFVTKSEVVSHTIDDVDVFSIIDDDNKKNVYINYIHVRQGMINQSFTYEYKRKLEESDEELLLMAITDIRSRFNSQAKEIIVPFEISWNIKESTYTVPRRGDKKHLLDLSEMNVKQYKFDRLKQAEKLNPEQKQTQLMKELQNKLQLDRLPFHIECFDNSNISGTDAVAGCIVYKRMKPSRKDYRKYNIKTVVGPDDYASMQEVVRRRYSRMIEEQTPLPDLIITDGGKGQMEAVRAVVEDELHLHIPIAGLAKDNHHRTNELLFGNPPAVVGLDIKSELFHVLTEIQDEVHRYAITFHRNKRSKHALHSELDDIKGLGPKGKEALLKQLKTINAIKKADNQEINKILGRAKGNLVYKHFHPEATDNS